MSSFEITSVDPTTRPWSSKAGHAFISYQVGFKGDQGVGDGELARPANMAAPTVGEVVDATIDNSNPAFPPKLREARKQGGGGGGGFRGKSPEERAEMRRMSAQKQAIALLAVEVQAARTLFPDKENLFDAEKASALLKPRIDFFAKDLDEAVKP